MQYEKRVYEISSSFYIHCNNFCELFSGSVDKDDEFMQWRRCAFVDYPSFKSPEEEALYGIDKWDSTLLNKSTFQRNYFQRQRPVQIVNQLNAGQKIWAFRDKPYFLECYGLLQVC